MQYSYLRTTTISFVTISFIFYAVFIPVFYQFSVNSCEEVLKKNMEKRPASFELLAGNLRYNVSVDPSFLFQNKYESLLYISYYLLEKTIFVAFSFLGLFVCLFFCFCFVFFLAVVDFFLFVLFSFSLYGREVFFCEIKC